MVIRKLYMVIEHGTNNEQKPYYNITYFEFEEPQSIFFDEQVKKLENNIMKEHDVTEEELHAIGNGEKGHPFFDYDISEDGDKVTYIDYCGPKTVSINKDSVEVLFRDNKKIWEV